MNKENGLEWSKIEFCENRLKFEYVPKKWQPLLFLAFLGVCVIPLSLIAIVRGYNTLIRILPTFVMLYIIGCVVLYFLSVWLPPATLCKKVGFGNDGMYIFNDLNKFTRKPLYIPYAAIQKLVYVPWQGGYSVFYLNQKGRRDTYATAFTEENIERLRERLRELKEKGMWSGKLEIVRLVDRGMKAIPEDELDEWEKTQNKR